MAINPNSKPKSKKKQHQSKHLTSPVLRILIFWGLILAGSAISGASLAMMLATKPLGHKATNHPSTILQSSLIHGLEQPINILILGIDNTDTESSNAVSPDASTGLGGNSDTMLLVRLLPKTHQINVLSIPRDTLVELPEIGIDKINDANPVGGTDLAAHAVSRLVGGIQIDRYIRLGTQGLTSLVDSVGGVSIEIPKPMDYIDKTQKLNIHFAAGRQHLTGQQLQEYVRFRHDKLGDIGRVQRQQVVLRALADRILKPQTLPKIPALMQTMHRDVETDLSVEELLAVTRALAETSAKNINFVMLPGRFSRPDEYELSYWIADPEKLAPIVSRYFSDSKTDSNNDRLAVPIRDLSIAVVNASGQRGIDLRLVSWLHRKGFSNVYVTDHEVDANEIGNTTQIVAQHGNPQSANDLQKILSKGQVQVESTGDILSDLTVVVGSDLIDQLEVY